MKARTSQSRLLHCGHEIFVARDDNRHVIRIGDSGQIEHLNGKRDVHALLLLTCAIKGLKRMKWMRKIEEDDRTDDKGDGKVENMGQVKQRERRTVVTPSHASGAEARWPSPPGTSPAGLHFSPPPFFNFYLSLLFYFSFGTTVTLKPLKLQLIVT